MVENCFLYQPYFQFYFNKQLNYLHLASARIPKRPKSTQNLLQRSSWPPISNQAPREGKQRASLKNIPTVKSTGQEQTEARSAQHSTSSPGTGENFHGSKAAATRRWGKGLLKGKSANGDGRHESKAAAEEKVRSQGGEGERGKERGETDRQTDREHRKRPAVQLRACTPILLPAPHRPQSQTHTQQKILGAERVGREDCQTPGHVSASNISPKTK